MGPEIRRACSLENKFSGIETLPSVARIFVVKLALDFGCGLRVPCVPCGYECEVGCALVWVSFWGSLHILCILVGMGLSLRVPCVPSMGMGIGLRQGTLWI